MVRIEIVISSLTNYIVDVHSVEDFASHLPVPTFLARTVLQVCRRG